MPPAPQRVELVEVSLQRIFPFQSLPSFQLWNATNPFNAFTTHNDFLARDSSASSLCQGLHNENRGYPNVAKPYALPCGKYDFPKIALILRRFGETKDLSHGKAVHASLKSCGYDYQPYIGNFIIQMYGNCGSIVDAQAAFDVIQTPNLHSYNILIQAYALNGHFEEASAVFESMAKRNVVSWTTIITCAAQQGFYDKAMTLFHKMESEGIAPNIITFISILEACTILEEAWEIHASLVMRGIEAEIVVATALITMYGSCSSLTDARYVFTMMPKKNAVSWGALITALSENGKAKESLEISYQMNKEDVLYDKVIYICALHACASYGALDEGKNVHTKLIQDGLEQDTTVGNALVTLYGRCSDLDSAAIIFLKMPKRNATSWSAMISACAQNGNSNQALKFFNQMESGGFQAHIATHVSVLNACSDLMALKRGRDIHLAVVKNGSETNNFLGNSFVNLYGKCGRLAEARSSFNRILQRDVIAWNGIISACAQSGQGVEALEHFHQMLNEGVEPDNITFILAMEACTSVEHGKLMYVTSSNLECKPSGMIGSSLITTYCGYAGVDNLRIVNERVLEQQNHLIWSTMLETGTKSDCRREVLDTLHQAQQSDLKLKDLASILTAHHYSGFHATVQHGGSTKLVLNYYASMIDILNRAGHLLEAEDFLKSLPNATVAISWLSLLCSCRIHGDVQRGQRAADQCFESDPSSASPYFELIQLCTAAS